jgi:hypothetical protein
MDTGDNIAFKNNHSCGTVHLRFFAFLEGNIKTCVEDPDLLDPNPDPGFLAITNRDLDFLDLDKYR